MTAMQSNVSYEMPNYSLDGMPPLDQLHNFAAQADGLPHVLDGGDAGVVGLHAAVAQVVIAVVGLMPVTSID